MEANKNKNSGKKHGHKDKNREKQSLLHSSNHTHSSEVDGDIELKLISMDDSDHRGFRATDDDDFIHILLYQTLFDFEELSSSSLRLLFRHMR